MATAPGLPTLPTFSRVTSQIHYYGTIGASYRTQSGPTTIYPVDKVSRVFLATIDDPLDMRAAHYIARRNPIAWTAVAPRPYVLPPRWCRP